MVPEPPGAAGARAAAEEVSGNGSCSHPGLTSSMQSSGSGV